jgi:hypothetical protein
MRGEAAVAGISSEKGTIAEIFHALLTETADAAGVSEPGNPNPVTDPVGRDMAADEVDAADDFMARNNRIFDAGKLSIDDVKVGPANATRAHFDAYLPIAGDRVRALLYPQRRPWGR